MPLKIPFYLIPHNRRIANLYKTYVRLIEGNSNSTEEARYQSVLIRRQFDDILCERDVRVAKQMLLEKEAEIKQKFPLQQIYFPDSPKGVAFERNLIAPDAILDLWHPFEKAAYPTFFTKRELRKQQYIEMWNKIHGPQPPVGDEH